MKIILILHVQTHVAVENSISVGVVEPEHDCNIVNSAKFTFRAGETCSVRCARNNNSRVYCPIRHIKSHFRNDFIGQMTQHSIERQWSVNQVKNKSHQAQLTKTKSTECNKTV